MILLLLFVTLVVWTFIYRFRRRRMYKLASEIPAPAREAPVIGVAHIVTGSAEDVMNTLKELSYESMKHNGIIRAWLNHILYFVVTNPEDLEVVLKTCLEKDDLHRFIRKVIGNGGIFAPVSIWRRRRKILIPAFSPKVLEHFSQIFYKNSQKLVGKLCEAEGKGNFRAWSYLSSYSLDSVCETSLGVQLSAQDNLNNSFLTSLNIVLDIVCSRIFHLWLQPDWLFKWFPQYKHHEEGIRTLHNFTDEVIKNKRIELSKDTEKPKETGVHYNLSEYRNKTLLDLLILLSGGEKGYTNIELREEILTLTIAGTDTTATAAGYILKLLAKYPKVQQKLYEEISEIFGNTTAELTREDLSRMKYLERVIKESLRLFPPVPFVIRKVETELKLPSGRILPAGSGLVVSIWGCHRDPKYWGPDAEHFEPDRFLPTRFNLQHACSFMPFSNGPRNCVGYQYALMSIKTSIAMIVRHFKVVGTPEVGPIPHINVKLNIMMKDVDNFQIALETRPESSVLAT